MCIFLLIWNAAVYLYVGTVNISQNSKQLLVFIRGKPFLFYCLLSFRLKSFSHENVSKLKLWFLYVLCTHTHASRACIIIDSDHQFDSKLPIDTNVMTNKNKYIHYSFVLFCFLVVMVVVVVAIFFSLKDTNTLPLLCCAVFICVWIGHVYTSVLFSCMHSHTYTN